MASKFGFPTLWDNIALAAAPGPDLRGTPFSDTLYGTKAAEEIFGLDGDDWLYGGKGADTLYGGNGNDLISYEKGDSVSGGAGYDMIDVKFGSNPTGVTLNVTGTNSAIVGVEAVNGTLSPYNDVVIMDDFSIYRRGANQSLSGGGGTDLVELDYRSAATLSIDVASAQATVWIDVRKTESSLNGSVELQNFESLRIYGSAHDDSFALGGSNDTIYGGGGNDYIDCGLGSDKLYGGDGDDYFANLIPGTLADGGTGIDRAYVNLRGATESVQITNGGTGNLAGIERVGGYLTNFDDRVEMTWTSDFDRGRSFCSINAGTGNDLLILDFSGAAPNDFDRIVFTPTGGSLIGTNYGIGASGFERFNITGSAGGDEITGGKLSDTLAGSAGDDILWGQDGSDLMYGGDGVDHIYGNVYGGNTAGGNESLYGGNGNDVIRSGKANDLVFGGNNDDDIVSGGGNDSLHGGEGHDQINAQDGNDAVFGEGGNDLLNSGNGFDTISGGLGYDVFLFDYTAQLGDKVITDFEVGYDTIYLDLIPEDYEVTHFDSNTVVSWQGGSVTVLDVLLE